MKNKLGSASLLFSAVLMSACSTLVVISVVESAGRGPAQSIALTFVGVIFMLALALVPTYTLPAFALGTFIAFPPSLMPDILTNIPPGSIVMLAWFVRNGLNKISFLRKSYKYFYSLFVLLTLLSLLSSVDKVQSTLWLVAFIFATAPVVYLDEIERSKSFLLKFWQLAAVIIGLYGLMEYLLTSNPIYGAIYRSLGADSQHWATYRPYMSFGHPVPAASFMAVTSAIMLTVWLRIPTRRNFLVMLASVVGLLVPLTRGGYLAFLFAVIVSFVYIFITKDGTKMRKRASYLLIAGSGVIIIFLANTNLLTRFTSDEASGALTQRLRTIPIVLQAALTSNNPAGAGPAMSSNALGYEIGSLRYVENAYLQALLNFGWVGLSLFIVLLLAILLQSWQNRNLVGIGAIVSLAVSIGTFNALDGHYSIFVLMSCAMLLARGKEVSFRLDHVHTSAKTKMRKQKSFSF